MLNEAAMEAKRRHFAEADFRSVVDFGVTLGTCEGVRVR